MKKCHCDMCGLEVNHGCVGGLMGLIVKTVVKPGTELTIEGDFCNATCLEQYIKGLIERRGL